MSFLFWRRPDIEDFAVAIRPELTSLPNPALRQELFSRILASRESGVRIILPDIPSAGARPRLRLAIAAAVIAALLLLAVIPRGRSSNGSTDDTWASPAFLGNAAYAQTTVANPALPHMTFERASQVRPIAIQYSRRLRDTNGRLTTEFHGDVSLVAATLNGAPAWRLTSLDSDVTTHHDTHADTVFAARSSLTMLSRAVHVSPYRRFQRINIQQRFAGDSVTGRMNTNGPSIGAGRAIARKLDPSFGPYLSDSFVPIFFIATPLHRTWRGSASLLGWAVIPSDVFVPVTMRVEGEERITVPAGTFDCWRIGIDVAGKRISYWARKTDGLGVRMYNDNEASTKGTREVVLTSVR